MLGWKFGRRPDSGPFLEQERRYVEATMCYYASGFQTSTPAKTMHPWIESSRFKICYLRSELGRDFCAGFQGVGCNPRETFLTRRGHAWFSLGFKL